MTAITQVSTPNENGVLEPGAREVVASRGRSYADVEIALCPDGLYRFSAGLHYSYGGFSGPITEDDDGFSTFEQAKTAGMHELLRRWHNPFPSEPESVHRELDDLKRQIEDQLKQPSLF